MFSEVLANLGSVDKTSLVRLSRIRAAAGRCSEPFSVNAFLNALHPVETCSARVLEEGERKIYGWTLFSPEEPNMRFTQKLEEKILLVVRECLW